MHKSWDQAILSAVQRATEAVEHAVESSVGAAQQAMNAALEVVDLVGDEAAYAGRAADHELSRVLATPAALRLVLTQRSGSVVVQGHEQAEARLQARVWLRSSSPEESAAYAQRVAECIELAGDRLSIVAPTPPAGKQARIDWTLSVPRDSQAEVELHNGRIRISELAGPVNVSSQNGHVEVTNARAEVRAKTTNGSISLSGAHSVSAESQNGAISIANVSDSLSARSTNGAVRIDNVAGQAKAKTVNGSIALSGAVVADVDLETQNGAIDLYLPADSRFELDADVKVGRAKSHLPFREQGEPGPVGDTPLPLVKLRSVVGSITLHEQ